MSLVAIFIMTRLFDVGLATAAAAAAGAAGAHAAGVPLTTEILRDAAVGGALKSGAMAVAGLFMLARLNTPFIVIPMLLGTTMATNVLLVAALANRTLGYAPTQLLVAAVVAGIPLGFCPVYYYGAFRVPITFTSIPFDVLGAYTFVKMADNLGHPICPLRPALVAGAVFGTVFSVGLTLFGCWFIGRPRIIRLSNAGNSLFGHASCCGNQVVFNSITRGAIARPPVYGSLGSAGFGVVSRRAHALGIYWEPGAVGGGLVLHAESSANDTVNFTTGGAEFFRMA
ncbi:hypothetical protein L209DRAFT_452818 [Thermothelomyces heterothallicus CBS 203.75]